MRLFTFAFFFLFKKSMTASASDKDQYDDECLQSQLSEAKNFDGISIPADFMSNIDDSIINELLKSSNDVHDNENTKKSEFSCLVRNITPKDLIIYIRAYILKHLSSQKINYPAEFYQVVLLIDILYHRCSEIDFTVLNRNASNVFYVKIKISLIIILNHLKCCIESGIFKDLNDLSEQTRKLRLTRLFDLLSECKSCVNSLFEFLNLTDEVKTYLDLKEKSSLKIKAGGLLNQTIRASGNQIKSLSIDNSSNLSKQSDNFISRQIKFDHLFTCDLSCGNKMWRVKSCCKSLAGIWYFALSAHNFRGFKILKIDQKNFNLTNSNCEIFECYSTTIDGDEKIDFFKHCRKILVNSTETLYILKFGEDYSSFEILALNSDFNLIKKLDSNSFKKLGLKEPFIEDFEIYSNLIYMLDSENKCIVVTDFDFNIKRIIKVDIELKKLKDDSNTKFKNRISLFVTENYCNIHSGSVILACPIEKF